MVCFMENPIKLDDLGVPLFLETTIWVVPKKVEFLFEEGKGVTVLELNGSLDKAYQ